MQQQILAVLKSMVAASRQSSTGLTSITIVYQVGVTKVAVKLAPKTLNLCITFINLYTIIRAPNPSLCKGLLGRANNGVCGKRLMHRNLFRVHKESHCGGWTAHLDQQITPLDEKIEEDLLYTPCRTAVGPQFCHPTNWKQYVLKILIWSYHFCSSISALAIILTLDCHSAYFKPCWCNFLVFWHRECRWSDSDQASVIAIF